MSHDMDKYFDEGRTVKMLVWLGLSEFREEYAAEFLALSKHLRSTHEVIDFLVQWVVECNRSRSDRQREQLHPDRDLLKTSLRQTRYRDDDKDNDEEAKNDDDRNDQQGDNDDTSNSPSRTINLNLL